MKKLFILVVLVLSACGPSKEERAAKRKADLVAQIDLSTPLSAAKSVCFATQTGDRSVWTSLLKPGEDGPLLWALAPSSKDYQRRTEWPCEVVEVGKEWRNGDITFRIKSYEGIEEDVLVSREGEKWHPDSLQSLLLEASREELADTIRAEMGKLSELEQREIKKEYKRNTGYDL